MQSLIERISLLITLSAMFVLSGCVSRNQRDFLPKKELVASHDTTCSVSHLSFARCIKPIIQAKCNTCHSPTSTDEYKNEFVFFTDFAVLQRYATQKYVGRPEVKLQSHIKAVEPNVFKPMPLVGTLSDKEKELIDAWIAKGAPND